MWCLSGVVGGGAEAGGKRLSSHCFGALQEQTQAQLADGGRR